ncbi:hypothetical protein BsWGS_18905 [Bradybaena similaris]
MEAQTYFFILVSFLAASIPTSQQQQCLTTLDLIFLVDGSNSMGQDNFERQKQSLNRLVSQLNVSDNDVHIGLVLFSKFVHAVIELTGNKTGFIEAHNKLDYPDEETRLDLAIDRGMDMFNRTGRNSTVPKVLMVITDGMSTDAKKTIVAATLAKSLGIKIFSIGVTNATSRDELTSISSPGTQVFITKDFTTLESVLNNATNRVCQDLQTTTKSPSTVTQAPATTTQPPATTTQPPVTTTQPPVTTTQPPVTTTQPPVTTTRPPVTTTQVTTTQVITTQVTTTQVTTTPTVTTASPPIEDCYLGQTDLWLVVDVSQTTETLSRAQTPGDFSKLKTGLTKLVQFLQDPRVANSSVRLGLLAYSDTSKVVTDVTRVNSVIETGRMLQQLPAGVPQGGAALTGALANINTAPVNSSYKSYILIVAPQSSLTSNRTSLREQLTRLKTLGYTAVIFSLSQNSSYDLQGLQADASGPRYFYDVSDVSALEAQVQSFANERLCNGRKNGGGLCAESGHREKGVGVVAHPKDCDKYIQCYYDERNDLDLGIVRNCPMGLHWNVWNGTCTLPSQANCSNDRCKEECSAYKMEGSCGGYWECEDGVSSPMCCERNQTFVPELGCQPDEMCKEDCRKDMGCGKCQKKPNWKLSSGYDVMILGGNMWLPRPCFLEDFDAVDCDCTAPREHVCPASREFDFTDSKTRDAIDMGVKDGIRVSDVTYNPEAVVLGHKSAVHVTVDKGSRDNQPFTLQFRFREMGTFSPYGETLITSGVSCAMSNSLLVSANDEFIFAEVKAGDRVSEVKVPLKGLNKDDFKDLVLSYHDGVLALSIKDEQTQYIAKTQAPDGLCFSCGLDIGQGLNKLSFDGEIQKIAVYACAWKLLY